ncbi:hypothetical protein P9112_014263 [Eukaryota sp. TZLM1-RC]
MSLHNYFKSSKPSSAPQLSAPAPVVTPWIEKFRPQRLSDVACQEETVAALTECISSGDLPHLLFYGPPGTGKTSTILAAARELYGPHLIRKRVLELNASDERGIQVVREKIKSFAQTAVGEGVSGYPCPPYKIIILDEADAMTPDAQAALRRIMEQYSRVTRFCLICNYVSRIIDPLTSRCAKFRFKIVSENSAIKRLETIAAAEQMSVSDDTLKFLVSLCDGDLRRAVNLLQSGSSLAGKSGVITTELIMEIGGLVDDDVVFELITSSQSGLSKTLECCEEIIANGFPVSQIFQILSKVISSSESSNLTSLSSFKASKILVKLAEADSALNDGADEYLQLLDVARLLSRCMTS